MLEKQVKHESCFCNNCSSLDMITKKYIKIIYKIKNSLVKKQRWEKLFQLSLKNTKLNSVPVCLGVCVAINVTLRRQSSLRSGDVCWLS